MLSPIGDVRWRANKVRGVLVVGDTAPVGGEAGSKGTSLSTVCRVYGTKVISIRFPSLVAFSEGTSSSTESGVRYSSRNLTVIVHVI